MKKKIKNILFILLFIPIFINARVNYSDSVSYANNYIYGFDEYRDYIYLNERIPFSYDETGNKVNNDFKSGGFLSRREYEISNVKGSSYLSNGLQYWTLTKSSYLKHYIVDYKLAEQFDQNLSGVRVTEYLKPTTKVSGKGSYGDPWTFKEMYSIYINSNLESTGKISETTCANAKGSIHLSLVEDETRPISICPATGYRILTNSCDKYIVPINGSSTEHIVRGLDKDNIICKITFAYITKGVTLKACNVTDANNTVHSCDVSGKTAQPNKFYVNSNTGYFFSDEDAQYKLEGNYKLTNLPSLTGYTFGGYQTSNGTIVVKSDGTLQNGTLLSSNVELLPKMTAKTTTVIFDANTGTDLSKTSYTVTYNRKYSENGGLATVKKAGSKFLGWYTSKTGGTKINANDLVKITSPTTYYARWETCPAGTQSNGVTCTNCTAGYYSAAGSSSCSPCAAGTYSGAAAGSCTACPAGQYNTGTANTKCNKCAAGKYNTGTGNTTCTACPAGKYNNAEGSTSCTNCAAGKFNTGTGNTTCQQCGAGTYSSAGASSCTQCNAGYYSSAGASSCTACPAGQYNTSKGQTSCSKCPAGKYNTGTANTTCTACPAGKYNNAEGSTSCSNCPAGKYSSSTGSTQCLNCQAGTYSSAGSSSCTSCAAGTYSAAGASSCTQCAKGTYNGSTGQSSCTNCPAGKYASTTGKTACDNCPAGKYSSSAGSSSCTACAAGTYTSSAGKTSCTTCPAGQYNTGTGNTTCNQCEAGYYCTGGQNRQQCQSGYTSDPGSDSSSDCYIADSTPPTCSISINSSTSIKATYSDSGGSGIAYYGWNSSYSGTKSDSKTASAATHTFYVKDGSGNTGTCKITLAKGTTTYLCDGATLTSWHSGPSNGCNVYNGTYQCWWNGSSCSCNMAGFYTGTPYRYYCCSSYDNYETADWDNKVNGYPGCTHYFGSTGTSLSCSSGYSKSNGWCYKR